MLLLAASYGLCITAFVLYGSLGRFNHAEGAMDGLFFGIILLSLPWLVVLAPFTGAVYYARRRRKRGRALIVLTPSMLVFLWILSPLLRTPPTVTGRFKQLTHHALPASAREVQVFDSGGGFEGVDTTFFFHCTVEDTEGLIRALGLQPAIGDEPQFSDRPDATWPDPRHWEGRTFYSKERSLGELGPQPDTLGYYLCTDATRTQVWLAVGP